MKIVLFFVAVLPLLAGAVTFGLISQWQTNLEWLDAKRRIVLSEDGGLCPAIRDARGTTVSNESGDLPRGRSLHALMTLAQGRAADAVQAYMSVDVAALPVDAFWAGCAAWEAGDTDAAVGYWRQAGAFEYFLNHGSVLMRTRRQGEAKEFYSVATQIAPESAAAHIGLAEADFDLAVAGKLEWAEARESAENALKLAPNDARPHYLLGAILWRSRADLTRAEKELRWAVEARGGWLEINALAALLLDMGKAGEPTALLRRALDMEEYGAARFNLFRAYQAEGRCELALDAKEDALRRYPDLEDDFDSLCRRSGSCPCLSNP